MDTNNYTIYVDGQYANTMNNGTALSSPDGFEIGRHGAWNTYFDGQIDEIRVSTFVRPTNWIWATFMTIASNAAFTTYAAPVQAGGASGATIHGIPYTWLTAHGITNTSDSVETQNLNGSGLDILQDYIAGTDPTNRNSCFSVIITNSSGQIVVNVPSVQASGSNYLNRTRYYDIEQCTNLLTGGTWQPVPGYSGISASGGIIACTNATPDSAKFYRVKVRLQ